MKPPREVYIVESHGDFFVKYKSRRRGQRYFAAQFYRKNADDSPRTLAQVQAWVNGQPKFKLVGAK